MHSRRTASVASATSSVARRPIMWTPRISSYFRSATILTNPSISLAILARAQHAELEGPDAHVVAALAGLSFGQADAPDLRIAIGAAGHLVVVDEAGIVSRDPFSERDTLGRRQVRELRMARLVERDDVAYRGDARHAGLESLVHVHVAALEPQAGLLGPRPAVTGPLPVATSRSSDVSISTCRPAAAQAPRRPSPRLALVTFVPVRTLMPCA